jgi:peptidoglycan/xylan/chitin deacetylase (PgdA/CDA1 family)
MVQPGRTKAAVSHLFARGSERMPMEWMRSLSGVSLVVPYYHMVSDIHVPHVHHLYRFRTIAEFTADVEYLMRHFKPVTLGEIVDALDGKRHFGYPCFHLTFDDGFREMHDIVAPILRRVGAPATFFLNTAFLDGGGLAHHNQLSVLCDQIEMLHPTKAAAKARVESLLSAPTIGTTLRDRILSIPQAQKALVRSVAEILEVDFDQYVRQMQPYLSSEQVAEMLHSGFTMGAHSHDHPRYADLSLQQQIEQTQVSMELVERRFGTTTRSFAFPYTDEGVEKPFFDLAFSETNPLLNVSFGTAGLVAHFHPRNIERVRMEKTTASAARILARQFLRAAYFRSHYSGLSRRKAAADPPLR